MAPENNSDLDDHDQDDAPKIDQVIKPPVLPVDSSSPNESQPETPVIAPVPTRSPSDFFSRRPPSPTTNASSDTPPRVINDADQSDKSKKSPLKLVLAVVVLLILFGVVGALSYHEGKSKRIVVQAAAVVKPISLPPEAIVSNACVPGRGKQYIIPKDIPEGPIYDVENSKVIAIEYVLSIQQLLTNSSSFSSDILNLTKNYPVDHFQVVPEASPSSATSAAGAGASSATSAASAAAAAEAAAAQEIHLIMFVVSAKEANSITCPSSSSSGSTSTSTSTTTPSTADDGGPAQQ